MVYNVTGYYPQFNQPVNGQPQAAPVAPVSSSIFAQTNDIRARIDELDKKAKRTETEKDVLEVMSPVITCRRISSLPDKLDNGDYLGAAAQIGLAGLLLPEDMRDVKNAFKQLGHIGSKVIKDEVPELPQMVKEGYHAPFSFIRGSFLEKPVNSLGELGYYIHKYDRTLLNTSFGDKVMDVLNVSKSIPKATERKIPKIVEEGGEHILREVDVMATKLEGPTIGKFICRALDRTTIYGTLALFALCIPSIINAFSKPKNTGDKLVNGSKQVVKSGISTASVSAGIGLTGALLAPLGPIGSVVGMGLGSIIGGEVSSKINKNIETQK